MERILIAEQLRRALPFYSADRQLTTVELKHYLDAGNLDGLFGQSRFLFDQCADKDFWLKRMSQESCEVEGSHPLCDRGNLLEGVDDLVTGRPGVEMFYEYFNPRVDLKEKLRTVGSLYYCEVYFQIGDEKALRQALIELVDCFCLYMSPIDEIFCRTRNHRGLSEIPDCITVFLKMVNGMEAHWFLSALNRENKKGMTFFGQEGSLFWDGEIKDRGVRRWVESKELIHTYRIVDWIHRSARFERSVSFRETQR